jgi:hypothetical protein
MADPTEDIPSDRPLGESDRDFELRTLRLGVAGTGGVGAVVELANQFHRTLKGVDVTVPVVTDIHDAPTDRAITVEDIEFPESEIRILGPSIRHPANLHAVVRSIDGASKAEAYTRNTVSSSPLADR